jgi:ABC-type Fe3+/spermidine/putrescine transport system ATPase subunit
VNLIDVQVRELDGDRAKVVYSNGDSGRAHVSAALAGDARSAGNGMVCVRPERVQFLDRNAGAENEAIGVVKESIYLGATTRTIVEVMGLDIIVTNSDAQNFSVPEPGSEMRIGWNSDDGQLLFD